ncbi:MAG: hypothetical protein UY24_C0001G0051 [Parcubacteria group bacterium GW2011_GWA1_48_11b]|nr:MAG: hypothetical protein UY24_C0001G0051 [Parcubacteria group bacterium GW2011_GWA1_48_11b]
MNRLLISLIFLFILISGVVLFLIYKDKVPTDNNIFKGKIAQIVPIDSNSFQIVLDTKTPQIMAAKETGVAKISDLGQVERFMIADELKVGDAVEIFMEYDLTIQSWSLHSIFLK